MSDCIWWVSYGLFKKCLQYDCQGKGADSGTGLQQDQVRQPGEHQEPQPVGQRPGGPAADRQDAQPRSHLPQRQQDRLPPRLRQVQQTTRAIPAQELYKRPQGNQVPDQAALPQGPVAARQPLRPRRQLQGNRHPPPPQPGQTRQQHHHGRGEERGPEGAVQPHRRHGERKQPQHPSPLREAGEQALRGEEEPSLFGDALYAIGEVGEEPGGVGQPLAGEQQQGGAGEQLRVGVGGGDEPEQEHRDRGDVADKGAGRGESAAGEQGDRQAHDEQVQMISSAPFSENYHYHPPLRCH